YRRKVARRLVAYVDHGARYDVASAVGDGGLPDFGHGQLICGPSIDPVFVHVTNESPSTAVPAAPPVPWLPLFPACPGPPPDPAPGPPAPPAAVSVPCLYAELPQEPSPPKPCHG